MNYSKLIFFVLTAFFFMMNPGFSKKEKENKVFLSSEETKWLQQHRNEIYFSPDPNYAPFEFYDEEDKTYKGLAHEYIRIIEKRMGVVFKIIDSDSFDQILRLARQEKVTIVNAVTATPERNNYLLFTNPFVEIKNVILTRVDHAKYKNLGDLAGKKVSVVKDYAITEYLIKNYSRVKLDIVPRDLDAILNVFNNSSDAAVMDLATASYLIKKEGISNIYVSGDAGYPIKLAIGSRKDWPELNSILQKSLNSITDEEREAINSRWIQLENTSIIYSRYFYGTFFLICILFLISLVVFILNKQLNRLIKIKTLELNNLLGELKASEARLRTVLQTIPDLIWLKDIDGVYLACNPMFERFFGAKENDITGKTDYDFVDRELADFFREKDRKAIEAGGPSVNEERITFADDGHRAMLETIKTPMYDDRGNLIGVLGIGRDITDRKQSEERINTLLSEKQLLLQEVHHRIKNNMNTIRGLLSLQHAEEKNPSAAASLRDAEMRVNSMIILFDKLYADENYRELSVKNYLDSLIRDIVYSSPDRGIVSIETDIEDRILNVNILTPLGIIINELITNSMKHAFTGRQGGSISVNATFSESKGRLIVQDNGIGIPETAGFDSSSGFGLSLVGMIVEQVEGNIMIERINGTRIILEFPV